MQRTDIHNQYSAFLFELLQLLNCIGILHQFKAFFHPGSQVNILILIHEHCICIIFFQKFQCIIHSQYKTGSRKSVCKKSAVADDRNGIQTVPYRITGLRIKDVTIAFPVFYEIFLLVSGG